jgi:hypothetical protein
MHYELVSHVCLTNEYYVCMLCMCVGMGAGVGVAIGTLWRYQFIGALRMHRGIIGTLRKEGK